MSRVSIQQWPLATGQQTSGIDVTALEEVVRWPARHVQPVPPMRSHVTRDVPLCRNSRWAPTTNIFGHVLSTSSRCRLPRRVRVCIIASREHFCCEIVAMVAFYSLWVSVQKMTSFPFVSRETKQGYFDWTVTSGSVQWWSPSIQLLD